jgi:hypothetical protein
LLDEPLDVVGAVVEGHEKGQCTDDLLEHFRNYKGCNSH